MSDNGLENHPLCELFPEISQEVLSGLADDIKKFGLQVPIVLFEGKILDGRSRYKACKMLNIEPTFEQYTGATPVEHVTSLNLYRRHLDAKQRADVAAKMVTTTHGGDRGQAVNLPLERITDEKAASLCGVSPSYVRHTRRLIRKAPDLYIKVKEGGLPLYKAVDELREQTPATQEPPASNDNNIQPAPVVEEKPIPRTGPMASMDSVMYFEDIVADHPGDREAYPLAMQAISFLSDIPEDNPSRALALKIVRNYINRELEKIFKKAI